MNKKRKVIKAAKSFIRRKGGKSVRIQALDLCLPLEFYKKVVNRNLNRRVKNSTILFEDDLIGIRFFISDVLRIILYKKKWGGENIRVRKVYLLNPEEHEELLYYIGKSIKKQSNIPSQAYHEGEKTENSIRPVKHRTMRTQ